MEISDITISKFQRKVWAFYRTHRRRLPWRTTHDPYKILVSELMLQQTQVSRVITFYNKWIQQWPTIQDLAHASRREVLQAWMGLGYNTRALRLQQAAKTIVGDYQGDVVQAMRQYQEIPGVGRYTSQAVLIFATNADLVTVDTNIRRIFIHEFGLPKDISERNLWDLALRCLPTGRSRDWHNALMDYGALHDTALTTGVKPKTRQGRFEGSNRQLRAQVIRLLLQQDRSFTELQKRLDVPKVKLQHILATLIEEDFISRKKNRYLLKD
ncbi:MAG TPA: Fe-S cluster assembly protein HesB [Candidatus Thermoplasmatota archaeon]|nr:Fe-S cluster assembly protein HesB [Candidatus Thermoplasmatota archaeon]